MSDGPGSDDTSRPDDTSGSDDTSGPDDTSGSSDTLTARLEVTGGGEVSDAELAALIVALTPVAVSATQDDATRTPAWARAALLENVGLRRVAGPGDLVQPGSRL